MIATVVFAASKDGQLWASNPSGLEIALLALLIGTLALVVGFAGVVYEYVELSVRRVGAHRPRALKKTDDVGWELDDELTHEYHFMLGEIDKYEVVRDDDDDDNNKGISMIMCACCNGSASGGFGLLT